MDYKWCYYNLYYQVLKATNNKVNGTSNDNQKSETPEEITVSAVHINKKQKILEKISYDDLEGNENEQNNGVHLNLSKVIILIMWILSCSIFNIF